MRFYMYDGIQIVCLSYDQTIQCTDDTNAINSGIILLILYTIVLLLSVAES